MLRHIAIEQIEQCRVGPRCTRRGLPIVGPVQPWVVDMEPSSQWPFVDKHNQLGEHVYVISGEVVEGSDRYGAGSYLELGPNSEHQPRTETGVRLLGFNLVPDADD